MTEQDEQEKLRADALAFERDAFEHLEQTEAALERLEAQNLSETDYNCWRRRFERYKADAEKHLDNAAALLARLCPPR